MRRARNDLEIVRLATTSDVIADEVVGFHAQQAIEKSLKAALLGKKLHPPRTHDLRFLARQVGQAYGMKKSLLAGHDLTRWATELRYPGPDDAGEVIDRRGVLKQVRDCVNAVDQLLQSRI